ncbi:MAG TPA: hypothetical protein VK723_01370, partial [Thermoplasmata archaeon]|nr:hypothetical protein [Thermoplasmata archaeon]
ETDEPAVIVFVEKKVPEPQLKRKDMIPKTLDEVKTDVIESGRLKAQAAMAGGKTRTDRWRPAPGGVSVGHIRITAGTLGGVVRRQGRRVVLSNNHVLAASNAARIGDPILQPGPADSGTRDDAIATLERFVEIRFEDTMAGGWSLGRWLRRLAERLGLRPAAAPPRNFVDAAIAKPIRDDLVADSILELERTPGIAEAGVGTTVRKSGRTTGVTEGKIVATDATVEVDYDRYVATFTDQLVAGPMSQGGDSGSLLLDDHGRAVGLLFAGSDRTTVFNRASRVAEALGIEF